MFVAYHKDTTIRLDRHYGVRTKIAEFSTAAAAKAAITRECKRPNVKVAKEDFLVAPYADFYKTIEKTETVQSIMGGTVVQGVNTPLCLDPSSETYWSA